MYNFLIISEKSFDKVDNYLNDKSNGFEKDEHSRWIYNNMDTLVFFWIEKERSKRRNGRARGGTRYKVYLRFITPDFYAAEIEIVLSRLCLRCKALIRSGYNGMLYSSSKVGKELYHYRALNYLAIEKSLEDLWETEVHRAYLPKEKSDSSWVHNFHRQDLFDKYNQEFFVPQIIYAFFDDNSTLVRTMITSSDLMSIMIPPVDSICLARDGDPPDVIAIISYDAFVERFREFLSPIDEHGYLAITREDSERLQEQRFLDTQNFSSEFVITPRPPHFTNVAKVGQGHILYPGYSSKPFSIYVNGQKLDI